MKKICYITTIAKTLDSFVLPIAKKILMQTDWEIYMICDPDEKFAKALPPEIHYIPVQMKRGISASGIKSMLKLRRIFKQEHFDLIQYSTPNASLYASIAGWLARVPVRLYCQWGMVFVSFQGFKRSVFKAEEKMVCRLSTWVEPDSYSNLNFAHANKLYSAKKSSVIGAGSACGINFDKFNILHKETWRKKVRKEYHIADNQYVYGFVGRMNKDKGFNELLAAFNSIAKEDDTVRLMLVGNLEGEELISDELLAWSKTSEAVIYCGVTNVVEEYLSAMDCYILPSYREGFGMGTIEAEAMGVPVIVTDIPGPIDAMKKDVTGLVIPKADAEALKMAMNKMRKLKNNSMGELGNQFVHENFEQGHLCSLIIEDRKRLLGLL